MTQEELDIILKKHKHWLNRDCKGWKFMQADLSYADLTVLDFAGRDLRAAVLIGANLSYADLRGANFTGAILNHAIFIKADLARANLSYADVSWANLSYADVSWANLTGANLREANLYRADLTGADLRDAILYGADLREAIMPNIPLACPSKGSFIAYKKSGVFKGSRYIIKLQIPEDAKRSSATTKKCRCDKAIVLAIENLDGTESDIKEIQSAYDSRFIYKVGETVTVNDFNPCRWNECDPGIHFFIDREEAVDY